MARSEKSIYRPEDFDKLPIWLQREIRVLWGDKDSLKRELSAGPSNSDTFVDGMHSHPDRPLGERPQINFGKQMLGTSEYCVLHAQWRSDDNQLYVNAPHGRLHVLPMSGNAIYIASVRLCRSRQ